MKATLEQKIERTNINQLNYPKKLKSIAKPPETLYFRGRLLSEKERGFAIVGTRRASNYGKEIAFSFAKELSRAGLTIVSGMARGIDTYAHKGAIEARGRTIAVLGTGLAEKTIYPQENLHLAEKIVKTGGCLISEYPPEYPGSKYTFPKRNRIIAGMSLAVLVVEAKYKSGALITARYAKEQNKKIFAVPGNIYSLNSKGPHSLIKQGSLLVEKPADILKALNIQQQTTKQTAKPKPSWLESSSNQLVSESKTEKLIISTLIEKNLHIDKIIEQTKLSPQQVSGALSLMEIEGKIKNLGGNVYALLR